MLVRTALSFQGPLTIKEVLDGRLSGPQVDVQTHKDYYYVRNKGLPLSSVLLVTQPCLTLCDPPPPECSPPGSSVHGILQARILEWTDIPFYRGSSWTRDRTRVSCTADRLFTVWAQW